MSDGFWDEEYGIVSEPSVLDWSEAENGYADEDDYRDEE